MIVLGISPLDKDSTISIVADGKVLFAAGEERFTRTKLQDGFPAEALQAGLDYTGVRIEEIDAVAYPFFDWKKETALFNKNLQDEQKFLEEVEIGEPQRRACRRPDQSSRRTEPIHGLADPNEKMNKRLLNKVFYRLAGAEGVLSRNVAKKASTDWGRDSMKYHKTWQEELENNLQGAGTYCTSSNAASTICRTPRALISRSGFDRALIVTLDG